MKVAIARALVHDPDTIFLDEPTNGLDVMATRHLRDWLRELRKQGRCVLLSSHVMQEVEALVDDLVIIAAGRVTLTGSPSELAQRYRGLGGLTAIGRKTGARSWRCDAPLPSRAG